MRRLLAGLDRFLGPAQGVIMNSFPICAIFNVISIFYKLCLVSYLYTTSALFGAILSSYLPAENYHWDMVQWDT